jgi:hypothetical protein
MAVQACLSFRAGLQAELILGECQGAGGKHRDPKEQQYGFAPQPHTLSFYRFSTT